MSNDQEPNFDGLSCPLPLRDYPEIVIGHGGGGKLSAELVEHLFLPAFQNNALATLGDSTVVTVGEERLAFSTDSFVVRPLFFPGGNIGDLAVNGTVNDLAMSGAKPLFLSAGFIIEEGFAMELLARVANSMSDAAKRAGVQIVTGDTKVVERGHGDGCYINTAGIGVVPRGLRIAPDQAQPGDVVILSGTIGDHGMAIMSVREGLEFDAEIESDSAPLHDLVAAMVATCPNIRALRDPTRGGVASSLNEIAVASNVGIVIEETALAIDCAVQSACEVLGLDPLFVANEGKLLAIIPAGDADATLAVMRQHEHGTRAGIIGRVTADHSKMVVAKTAIGATRVITMQIGEQLPRIC
jgi:hydrogenase expression/formation protein HypE